MSNGGYMSYNGYVAQFVDGLWKTNINDEVKEFEKPYQVLDYLATLPPLK